MNNGKHASPPRDLKPITEQLRHSNFRHSNSVTIHRLLIRVGCHGAIIAIRGAAAVQEVGHLLEYSLGAGGKILPVGEQDALEAQNAGDNTGDRYLRRRLLLLGVRDVSDNIQDLSVGK